MRVVVIADFAVPTGGAQTVAIQSALALADLGLAITFIHGVAGPVDPRLTQAEIGVVSLGLQDVWDLPALKAAAAGVWHARAARRLREALASLRPGPTVLHLHQWTRSLSPSVLPVVLRSGRPVAVTLHDYFVSCPNGVYFRFDQGRPCSLTPLSARCVRAPCDPRSRWHKAVRVARTALTGAAVRRAVFDVIHVSDRGERTLAPFLPDTVRHHRVDNPVEVARAGPAAIGPDAKVAYIGRLTREKGADLVAAAGRAAGMPVLFIGEGPAEAEIQRIDPQAEILGWRPRGEVNDILRSRVRAVVAPSRWYETGPLTVYEALAAGVPAIASSRCGAAEKVDHGRTGLVVEPEVESLADAFRALARDDVAGGMGTAAFERYWAAPLDPATHARRLVEVYRTMLARPA